MFLAIRDLRFAKGRFALMAAVIALITLLLVMLSGLTAGLGNQSTSAIAALRADQIVFGAPAGTPAKASFTESEVSRDQLAAWSGRDGVSGVAALGISQARAQAVGPAGAPGGTANVAVFGTGNGLSGDPEDGTVVVGETLAADLHLSRGSLLAVGGLELAVADIVPDEWYSHTGVIRTSLNDWRQVARAGKGSLGTVLAVTFDAGARVDVDAANAAAGTVSATREGSFQALGSFKSENGSLVLMQAFLYGISALVIVAFLTVWTVQRTRDIAVVKAMGGSPGYVLRDAMAQAGMVLAAGTVTGGGAGLLGGIFAAQAAPFLVTPATTLVPIAGILFLGLGGSVVAVRGVTRVDPLLALGGN
ncbi:putative ABC transport system permease protein [Arthrobacter sp. PvP023]|uniref:FtsX-like permease family protein n=1 Tax=Micrococcaceae TaxID=1268 RepID=UPI001AE8C2C8|nr:ABC transporter permease [Arthrobacter sp. PvP023]MBP1134084.1 putative ABC transport system permease protein [Arthrobacter sp. PvP023]